MAAKKKDGCIIFIDEIDGFLNIDNGSGAGNRTVTTLQECIDGFSQDNGVFTIATTNYPNSLPNGLKRSGRLDVLIEVGLPDKEARQNLFEFFLDGLEVSDDIPHNKLAEMTDSYTGSDIEGVVKEAGIDALVASHENTEEKIIEKQLTEAIEKYTPTGSRIMGLQKPAVSFDDIYGEEDLIDNITPQLDIISGKKESQYSNITSEAILLHGPTGTGKTFMAQAIADYLGVSFLYKSGSSFKSKWIGETEKNIIKMFADARTYAPVLLFIDEIDGIAKKRTGQDFNRHAEDALSVLLGEMDGAASNEGVYIVAATNVAKDLDPAVLSRLRRKIEMPRPNIDQRKAVLNGLFGNLPEELLEFDCDKIASATEGASQRNIKGLYDQVCLKLDNGKIDKVTTTALQKIVAGNN